MVNNHSVKNVRNVFTKNSYLPMTNLKKTVTGSVSIVDYGAIVYRYNFFSILFAQYNKLYLMAINL